MRNLDRINTITADNRHDWDELRTKLREHGVRPVIKYREFNSIDKAHNVQFNDDTYHRRSVVERSFRLLKQRYGNRLTIRSRYWRFRELTLKAAVKNIDKGIGTSHC